MEKETKNKYRVFFDEVTNSWVAMSDEGTRFHSDTPLEALEGVIHKESPKEVEEVKAELVEVEEVKPVEVKEQVFRPMDTMKYQADLFIDNLQGDDICKLSISTEIYMGLTPEGPVKVKGDEYFVLVARKLNDVPEGYVLQDTMPYPAKDVYNAFNDITAPKVEEE